jgi:hypothetical protein
MTQHSDQRPEQNSESTSITDPQSETSAFMRDKHGLTQWQRAAHQAGLRQAEMRTREILEGRR